MLWLAGMLIGASATGLPADRAGNRTVALAAAGEGGRRCTADRRWCARIAPDADGGSAVEIERPGAAPRQLALADPDGDSSFALRDVAVVTADGAILIEIERARTAGYSGGGGAVTFLQLVRAGEDGGLAPVLEVPLAGGKSIRACFSPRDRRARRGACTDDYEFAGTLTLDPGNAGGPPRFVLTTRARTYPGRRTLESDSTAEPPLRPADLVWRADPTCSYRRTFAFDAVTGGYAPDAPLPACPDYLDL